MKMRKKSDVIAYDDDQNGEWDRLRVFNLKFIILLSIILIFPLNANSETKKPWLGIEFQPITVDFIDKYNLALDSLEGIYIAELQLNLQLMMLVFCLMMYLYLLIIRKLRLAMI